MVDNEKKLFDAIFEQIPPQETTEQPPEETSPEKSGELAHPIQPIPLKSVDQLLREAKQAEIKQTG